MNHLKNHDDCKTADNICGICKKIIKDGRIYDEDIDAVICWDCGLEKEGISKEWLLEMLKEMSPKDGLEETDSFLSNNFFCLRCFKHDKKIVNMRCHTQKKIIRLLECIDCGCVWYYENIMKDYEQLEKEVLNDKIRRFEGEWSLLQCGEQFRAELLGRLNYVQRVDI